MSAADELLATALAVGASDIHLDPGADGLAVRLRVDGRFCHHRSYPVDDGLRLLGRLKVMAGLMVYRSDVPQEGRLDLPGGHEGRLAVIPTLGGEKATVRVFAAGSDLASLGDLSLDPVSLAWLRRQLHRNQGLVLVVGPSGSGKTTTLYAAVADLIRERGDFCHVVSIEDPVERRIAGCSQVQVDPVRELDFAAGLKFLLRQDPEVILVGEIRDADTARIAVRAAMTGHLVLSSLHCGRAAEARPRLLEMGVEAYAVDIALAGCLAQRLLRQVCVDCAGGGCEACLGTGFRGRRLIAELAAPDLDPAEGRDLAVNARTLVEAGLTRPGEVERVLGGGPSRAVEA